MTCAVEYSNKDLKTTILSKVSSANRADGWLSVVHANGRTDIPEHLIKSVNLVYDQEDIDEYKKNAEKSGNEDQENG